MSPIDTPSPASHPTALTVLVNSTDSYSDCWSPFFTLFGRYWPDCPYPILLNTERKGFEWPDLDVRATQVAIRRGSERPTWSECLEAALEMCETDVLLYLQEDYFLEARVRSDVLERLAPGIADGASDCVQLHAASSPGPWVKSEGDVWALAGNAPYRVSLQAALWRKSALERLLRRHETPWQLEIWGSRRARASRYRICSVNHDRYQGSDAIIPYTPTGVVRGRWDREIVEPLFEAENLEVDFAPRGFTTDRPACVSRDPFPLRVANRIRSLG
jgi:hypothetical protein